MFLMTYPVKCSYLGRRDKVIRQKRTSSVDKPIGMVPFLLGGTFSVPVRTFGRREGDFSFPVLFLMVYKYCGKFELASPCWLQRSLFVLLSLTILHWDGQATQERRVHFHIWYNLRGIFLPGKNFNLRSSSTSLS
jgi:hypothetical protein